MKHYFLFDALLHRDKTAPLITSAKKLIDVLNIDAVPFVDANADVGNEYLGLNTLKFLEHYAYNLSKAADEQRDILCIEQSSLIAHAHTKEILLQDTHLKFEIAQRLEKHNISLNLNANVVALEEILTQDTVLETLLTQIKHPFSNFQAALFLGTNGCRAKKYRKEACFTQLFECIKLKSIAHESMYESDGFEVNDTSLHLSHQLAATAMIDMFDHAADFVVISDARSFIMFDHAQKELEKVINREIGLSVFSMPELLLLAMGITDKKMIGLDRHSTPVTLL